MEEVSAKTSLSILCLEDNPNDRQLMEVALAGDGLNCRFTHVEERKEFEAALKQKKFDLIVSDFTLPSYDGRSALSVVRELQPETPFILFSGTIGEERAVEFLKSGATDCVVKDNFERLGSVVRRALREAEERAKRKNAEEALRAQASQLRALAARLQASREEERILISREIHDELGEVLTAQKLGLSWIRNRLSLGGETIPWKQVFEKIDMLGTLAD